LLCYRSILHNTLTYEMAALTEMAVLTEMAALTAKNSLIKP